MTSTTAYSNAKLGASSHGLSVAGWMLPTVATLALAAAGLQGAGAPLLARLPRPHDAFLIYGATPGPVPKSPSTDGCP